MGHKLWCNGRDVIVPIPFSLELCGSQQILPKSFGDTGFHSELIYTKTAQGGGIHSASLSGS